jgi:hypothetical protein
MKTHVEDIRNAATALLTDDRLTGLPRDRRGGNHPRRCSRWRRRRHAAERGIRVLRHAARPGAQLRQRLRGPLIRLPAAVDASGAADTIEAPVLIVHSEVALAPDLARAFYAAVKSPKQELWLQSRGQIDFYDDPKLIAPATDAVAAFCR